MLSCVTPYEFQNPGVSFDTLFDDFGHLESSFAEQHVFFQTRKSRALSEALRRILIFVRGRNQIRQKSHLLNNH